MIKSGLRTAYQKRAGIVFAAVAITLGCGAPPPPPPSEPQTPIPEAAPLPEPAKKAAQWSEGSIEYYAAASDWVIIGKVIKNESKWMGKKIATTSEVEPIAQLKGQGMKNPISVSFLGGAVGVIRQDFSNEITLTQGETAVLFLKQPLQQSGDAAGLSELTRIVYKIPLLSPRERESRLKNNRRLVRYQQEIADQVRKGAK